MADYYSILKKTIASLPENNGAARRSVYSRARNAIVNQLKAYEPPLAPSEITAEQLRLEESIRKVEAEAARESLGLNPTVPKVETPAPEPEVAAPPVTPPQVEPAAEAAPEVPAPQEPEETAAPSVETPAPSPLKETLSQAEALGTAASQAVHSAKEASDPSAAPVRQEPSFGGPAQAEPADDGLFEPTNDAAASVSVDQPYQADETGKPKQERASKKDRNKRSKPKASDALRGDASGSRTVPIVIAAVLLVLVLLGGAYFLIPAGDQSADNGTVPATSSSQTASDSQPVSNVEPPVSATAGEGDEPSKNTDRLLNEGEADVVAPDARTVTTTTITGQSDTSQADTPATPEPAQPSIVTSTDSDQTPAAPENPVAVPADNLSAISPDDNAPAPSASAADSSVQRSILYEEGEESGGAGTAAQGAVVWSVEEETNLDGEALAVLSASVEIPERDVKVDIRIKPNDDNSLPASHLVEIRYEFPENFAAGDVVNVPGLVMKPTEEARGDALIGASVKVSPGFFWIALSSLPNEQQRNLALLRERGWIDIPMLYENGKRGILTLEKGTVGADAVEKAITAWQAG
ncbi:hypothetical protein FMN63_05345 [Stappia sp. BW2]|uniref:hypothetical protein n=1 Tax=Stappia sp. BW2 TaxID=2592622 RepID=UPI0011DE6183|nr:hypothetical protein [Stappia sp. BW2]TYC75803.1 hypothetical protein FMN63_05345 [Stappia sp. BW2]